MKTKLYTQSGEWQGTLNVEAVSKRLRELADAIDSGDILPEDTSESTMVGRQDFAMNEFKFMYHAKHHVA